MKDSGPQEAFLAETSRRQENAGLFFAAFFRIYGLTPRAAKIVILLILA
jgi:hypothetical protein